MPSDCSTDNSKTYDKNGKRVNFETLDMAKAMSQAYRQQLKQAFELQCEERLKDLSHDAKNYGAPAKREKDYVKNINYVRIVEKKVEQQDKLLRSKKLWDAQRKVIEIDQLRD